MLKKFLIGTVVALALFVGVAAQAADFGTVTLKVGSKGPAVVALQTLVGATADGAFGPMTKAKVIVWQKANGLTADGLFGAKSKAVANGGSAVSTGNVTCPAGMTCTPVTPVVVACPAGYTCTSTNGTAMTGNTDGSITPSASSYISSSATIKKGETKDIVGVKLQAISGPVKVSYVDVQMSVRPWLYFSTLTLRDNTGKVLATKDVSNASASTEITVGSLYQVRFDGLNYVVTPGTNPDLAVSATVLAATDKIVTTQAVTSNITSIKTVSEVGYANTVSVGSTVTTNTVTLTATGSVATLYTRLSPSSPLAGQQVVSLTATTPDVVLGAFSLKTTNNTSSLNTFVTTLVAGTKTDFSNFRLFYNGSSIAGGSLNTSTGVLTFSNLNVPLALDTWTDFVVKADINANPTSATVYMTLAETGITVTDANYGSATITTGTRTASTLTLTTNSVVLSGASATLGSAIVQSNSTVGYNATYAFTLTNSSNNDLYVSATPSTFLTMLGAGSTGTALTNLSVSSPSTMTGDSTGVSYVIPASSSRAFSFSAALRGASNTSTTFYASAINYGTATGTPTGAQITNGLTALTLTASF